MAHVASYKKRGTRVWRCEYEDSNGTRRRRLFRTREAADDFLADVIKTDRKRLNPDLPSDISVADYAARWILIHFPQVKEATRKCYEVELRVHLLPALGSLAVRDLTRPRIKRLLAEKLAQYAGRGKDGRPAIRLMLAVLHLLLESAREDQLITANPAERLSKMMRIGVRRRGRSERVKALTRAQRDCFLDTARRVDPPLWRLWAVHVLGGYRPGEVYALTEGDLHLDDGRPTVRVEKTLANDGRRIETSPKGNQARDVDLSAAAAAVLGAHLAWRKEEKLRRGWRVMPAPLFFAEDGGYLRPSNIRDRFKRVLRAAGLAEHYSPHSLRHTFASLALDQGKDVYYVCRMVGHASIQETVDTYARWLPANRHGELDSLDPAFPEAL
jgi:integrase